jgi:hypothetical protein
MTSVLAVLFGCVLGRLWLAETTFHDGRPVVWRRVAWDALISWLVTLGVVHLTHTALGR